MNDKAYYSSFESFALVDGPGVRSVLFLSGCPFRCLYCHNPETWDVTKANLITVEEAFKKLYRYKTYWKDNGGITISGGEPLSQIDFLISLFKMAKEHFVDTCIDTSGAPFSLEEPFISKFNELLKYLDLIMLDIKAPNDELHKKITGKTGENVREMFKYLDKLNFPIWIRYVLTPGLTDDEATLKEAKAFIDTLSNVKRVEVLPYHPFALAKYNELGIDYKLIDVKTPTMESIAFAESILDVKKYQ